MKVIKIKKTVNIKLAFLITCFMKVKGETDVFASRQLTENCYISDVNKIFRNPKHKLKLKNQRVAEYLVETDNNHSIGRISVRTA